MNYLTFDPADCRFAKAGLSMNAHLGVFPAVGPKGPYRSLFAQHAALFAQSRYALRAAMADAGVGADTAVLLPAYHCRTMIDPAEHLGATTLIYSLGPDLVVRIEDLDAAISRTDKPVRALVLTYFFGWPQPVAAVRAWCDARGIKLIEDCAHRPWGALDRPLPGAMGDYATASPYKLVAGMPFGLLLKRGRDGRYEQPSVFSTLQPGGGLALEAKTWLRAMSLSLAYRRARPGQAALARLPGELARLKANCPPCGRDSVHEGAGLLSDQYDRALAFRTGPRWPALVFQVAPFARISAARRLRYAQWLRAVAGLAHARPLFAELPAEVVPAFFPLLIDHPAPHFYLLKRLGLPIWRWDDLALGTCTVSEHYRLHLLHLPCHQSLSDADMAWMTSAVRAVFALDPESSGERG